MPDEVKARRFPPPWTSEETEACFIVRDNTGRALALCLLREGAQPPRFGELTDKGRSATASLGNLPLDVGYCIPFFRRCAIPVLFKRLL